MCSDIKMCHIGYVTWNGLFKELMNYLEVRKEVWTCGLGFRGFKVKIKVRQMYLKVKNGE